MEHVVLAIIAVVIARLIYQRVVRTYRHLKPRHSRYIPKAVKAQVLLRDGGVCRHCGTGPSPGHPLEFDHIVPFSWGGKSDASNLQLLCHYHNQKKSDRYAG